MNVIGHTAFVKNIETGEVEDLYIDIAEADCKYAVLQLVESVLTELDVHWVCATVLPVVDAVVIIGD